MDLGGVTDDSLQYVIVDDINDTGATFEHIRFNCDRNENVRYAAVINNKPSPFTVDYHGYEIDKSVEDRWIVFPWEEWGQIGGLMLQKF